MVIIFPLLLHPLLKELRVLQLAQPDDKHRQEVVLDQRPFGKIKEEPEKLQERSELSVEVAALNGNSQLVSGTLQLPPLLHQRQHKQDKVDFVMRSAILSQPLLTATPQAVQHNRKRDPSYLHLFQDGVVPPQLANSVGIRLLGYKL